MRGADIIAENLFTMRRLDDAVPKSHPPCPIRTMVNQALAKTGRQFAGMYETDIKGGRASIAQEKLLRAMLLQVLYSTSPSTNRWSRPYEPTVSQVHRVVDGRRSLSANGIHQEPDAPDPA